MLHPREVVLLRTLLANRGRVVTRTELARAVGLRQQARRVDVHLVNVRRALDDSLINVRGRGWMVPQGYELSVNRLAESGTIESATIESTGIESTTIESTAINSATIEAMSA